VVVQVEGRYAFRLVPRPAPTATTTDQGGWLDCLIDPEVRRRPTPLLGVLPGEGIGPEVVDAALEVVRRLEEAGGQGVSVEVGGPIGRDAERRSGAALPEDVVRFCEGIFGRGGAILNGPGGGRYVYDLRRRLDLFLKISPIQVRNGLPDASPLRPETLEDVDLLLVRENVGGIYQGRSDDGLGADRRRLVHHTFSYAEADVRRFLEAAARLARSRRGGLTVVTKEAGVPGVSGLWRECATEAAEAYGVGCSLVDVDLIAYELVRRPAPFDVVAAPNLYGDVLGDLAAVLIGSRALSFSGNFTPGGEAVYQTNHGAAYDIAGTDRANPVGQMLSVAMLLRESLGLAREARAVETGIRQVWGEGWRTADIGVSTDRVVGTAEMAALVADAAAEQLGAVLRAA
jgi:3-isopropylmalate dehydrogenase